MRPDDHRRSTGPVRAAPLKIRRPTGVAGSPPQPAEARGISTVPSTVRLGTRGYALGRPV